MERRRTMSLRRSNSQATTGRENGWSCSSSQEWLDGLSPSRSVHDRRRDEAKENRDRNKGGGRRMVVDQLLSNLAMFQAQRGRRFGTRHADLRARCPHPSVGGGDLHGPLDERTCVRSYGQLRKEHCEQGPPGGSAGTATLHECEYINALPALQARMPSIGGCWRSA